ncbi:MAG: CoA-binding protein [Bilophila wadsworthia]
MSIFIHKDSRVVVQGVTGKEGAFWAKHMKDMGTQVVFGVTPGKEGQDVDGIPVYHSVRRGIKDHPADVAMLFVPPKFTKDAVFEALDAGIKKICTIADGIPLHEAIQIRRAALSCGAMVVGGNTSGIISVGEAMLGTIPYWIDRVYKKGHVRGHDPQRLPDQRSHRRNRQGRVRRYDPDRRGRRPGPRNPFRGTPPLYKPTRTPTPSSSSANSAARWKRKWPKPGSQGLHQAARGLHGRTHGTRRQAHRPRRRHRHSAGAAP